MAIHDQLAWHYTHARNLKSIIDSGVLRPSVRPFVWPKLWFTVDDFWEPSISPYLHITRLMTKPGRPLPALAAEQLNKDLIDSGGAWIRFGYPAGALFTVTEFLALENPLVTSPFDGVLKAPALANIANNWRVSFQPIAVPDFLAIDRMDDGLVWERIWTSPAKHQCFSLQWPAPRQPKAAMIH